LESGVDGEEEDAEMISSAAILESHKSGSNVCFLGPKKVDLRVGKASSHAGG
jgi:hypothetical protein